MRPKEDIRTNTKNTHMQVQLFMSMNMSIMGAQMVKHHWADK